MPHPWHLSTVCRDAGRQSDGRNVLSRASKGNLIPQVRWMNVVVESGKAL